MNLQIIKTLKARNLGSPRLRLNGRPYIGGICLHDTSGSGTHGDTKYLADPSDGRSVSVDFTVERDGSIYQLNPDLIAHCTFHAGRSTVFRSDGRKFQNSEVNRVLIGIELVQKADLTLSPVWPIDQVQAAAELCLFLCQTFSLTKDRITTHARIITDGSRDDPRNFPFDSFWFYFNKAANIPTMETTPAELGSPNVYEVAAGDTLFGIARKFNTSINAIKALNKINVASNAIFAGQKLLIGK
jgi:hypothetical protein